MAEDSLPTDLSTIALATVEAPWAKAGRRTMDDRPEKTEDGRRKTDLSAMLRIT